MNDPEWEPLAQIYDAIRAAARGDEEPGWREFTNMTRDEVLSCFNGDDLYEGCVENHIYEAGIVRRDGTHIIIIQTRYPRKEYNMGFLRNHQPTKAEMVKWQLMYRD